MSRCPTAPLPLNSYLDPDDQHNNKKKKNTLSSRSLQSNSRASMPILESTTRSASCRLTNQNEEWDFGSKQNVEWEFANQRDSYRDISSHGLTRPPPKVSLKGPTRNQINERLKQNSSRDSHRKCHLPLNGKLPAMLSPVVETSICVGHLSATPSLVVETPISNEELYESSWTGELQRDVPSITCISTFTCSSARDKAMSVTFAETHKEILHDGPPDDMNIKWYSALDNDQFSNDSKARAATVDRMMNYASLNEISYNSSTGLTAPSVLKDYLSNPEEIIGIEHLLSGQKNARESLKQHHKSALVKELRRLRQEGCTDPLLLAEMLSVRLRNTSNIASYMAQERAVYITLLD
jgi:hypothetical protein